MYVTIKSLIALLLAGVTAPEISQGKSSTVEEDSYMISLSRLEVTANWESRSFTPPCFYTSCV